MHWMEEAFKRAVDKRDESPAEQDNIYDNLYLYIYITT